MGVYFFFVLSGFLITYLLCIEKSTTGTLSIRSFYVRRILRIWPLYYLLVILGFFLLPQFAFFTLFPKNFSDNFYVNLLLYILILPNLAFSINIAPVPHIGQSWSIGVEEQFYVIWPLLIKKTKNIMRRIFIAFLFVISFKFIIELISLFHLVEGQWFSVLKKFIAMCKFESMIIGAAGAVILFEKREKILNWVLHPALFWSSVLLSLILSYFVYPYPVVQDAIHLPLSIMFLIIILNVAHGNRVGFLSNRLFDYLGRISYGIYMYHFIAVFIMVKLVYIKWSLEGIPAALLCYSVSIILSLLVSHLSYKYFESPFIRWKEKFSKIKSN